MAETQKKMRVTFLLPLPAVNPIGGFKVAYEYANFLASRGHDVSIVHPGWFRKDVPPSKMGLKRALKCALEFWKLKRSGAWRPTTWFAMRSDVKMLWVWSLRAKNIPEADAVVATSWETAEWAAEYPASDSPNSKGEKFYLIQHHETWSGSPERVDATWKLPLKKIVIAGWLEDIATSMGERAFLIHNGLDFERFQVGVPIEQRDPRKVLMLYHEIEWKGSRDGLKAFALAKAQVPELELTLFGVVPRPDGLPAEIAYHQNVKQDRLAELFNGAAIFLAPSWAEGFPLPPAEAMQCGVALVCTDIGGHAPYAWNGDTALLSEVKNPEAMAKNILRMVREPGLRERIARRGHEVVSQFTWEKAGERFEGYLGGEL